MTVHVAIAQINSTVGDLAGNADKILEACRRAHAMAADIVVTPELSLVGYPPEDLLLRPSFYEKTASTFESLVKALQAFPSLHVVLCYPVTRGGECFNAAAVVCDGEILGIYCKSALPNDAVFDEKRYFTSADEALVFAVKGVRFGINICEDTWSSQAPAKAREAGAEVLLIPNGSPFHMHKQQLRYERMCEHVCSRGMSLVYANLVGGQDELVFDGNSFVLDAKGRVCARLAHCAEDLQIVAFEGCRPSVGTVAAELSVEAQVYQVLVLGVRDYVRKNGFQSVVIGLSGGVDSALTLALAVDALGADQVRTVMMPSPYTAEISWVDSRDMAQRVGVRYDEIPIDACFNAFRETLANEFKDLPEDTTEENIQARIRGTILMALSNKYGSIVLTTGNKSELAVGYCTLYGDMAGGFAVIKDIAKTLVYRLCAYRNSISEIIPERILTRAPSAELRPDQTDQDSLPPYETLDAIMQMFVEENLSAKDIVDAGFKFEEVLRITRLIKLNEYKRRQAPVGIRITHRGFGRDWRYPITSKFSEI
ncbi:MAG: NAD+ synthase [Pseudomonadota bacterium]